MTQSQYDRLMDIKHEIEKAYFRGRVEKETYEMACMEIDKTLAKDDGVVAFKIIQRYKETFTEGKFNQFAKDVTLGDKIINL